MNQELLRKLPKVDVLLEQCMKYVNMTEVEDCRQTVNPSLLLRCVQDVISNLRQEIIENQRDGLPDEYQMFRMCMEVYDERCKYNLRPVINGTGITLHTNLGRSILSEEAAKHVYETAMHYTNLEMDIQSGKRGHRYDCVEELICDLTDTEAALVVNNNAAAVMLILHALGYGKNMVISRGELIEIGGSFRIPAIMEISGVTLKEVGCTNKTHFVDYEKACDDHTAAILKVHPSNFTMSGFTESVSIDQLSSLTCKRNIPLIYDMGSGDLKEYAHDVIGKYADVCCFSGDKLLGGPQAGVICGKRQYIDRIKKDDLLRTVRVDKMTLAALEVTLRQHLQGKQNEIPTISMLSMTHSEQMQRYATFGKLLDMKLGGCSKFRYSFVLSDTETGGGSRPGVSMEDVCIAIEIDGLSAESIAYEMRLYKKCAIIGRIHEDRFLLSVRTMNPKEYDTVIDAIADICS